MRIFGQNYSILFLFPFSLKVVNISAMVVRAGLCYLRGQLQIVFHKLSNDCVE